MSEENKKEEPKVIPVKKKKAGKASSPSKDPATTLEVAEAPPEQQAETTEVPEKESAVAVEVKAAETQTPVEKAEKAIEKAEKAVEKAAQAVEKAEDLTPAKPVATDFDSEFISLELDTKGIAVAWFDTPEKSVNLLSPAMLKSINALLDHVSSNPGVNAVIFASKKKDNFIAGADLVSMVSGEFSVDKAVEFGNNGRDTFQRVAELEVPTIAAIHGSCLGGGLELSLACDYRIAANHPKTKIGLPEVQLGILPAWGGSQRLPRLVSLPAALDLMLTGKQINARKAKKIGLVQLTPPMETLMHTARTLAQDVLNNQASYLEKKKPKTTLIDKALNNLAVGQNMVFKQARKGVMDKSKGFYPAPLKILESVQNGINLPLHEAFKIESQAFRHLLERSETSNLMNLFFINQDLAKLPEIEDIKPQKVKMISVLGAGYMGAGIAQVSNFRGMEVRLKDISYDALLNGMKAIHKNYKGLVKRKKLSQKEAEDKMRTITATTDFSGFQNVDLVIEAVVERMDVKKAVFEELNKHLKDDAIIASNTSALSINEMAEASGRPDRFIGLHFFGPVHKMPLVEVIVGEKTSNETLATALSYVKSIGKTPVVIRKDVPGFVVNRILAVYGNEACLLLEEGADMTTVDQLMKDFGMPMGIFEVIDLAGVDVAYHTGETVKEILKDRPGFKSSELMKTLFDAKRLGQKNGRGFYIHTGKESIPDHRYIAQLVEGNEKREITGEEIRDRLILSILNESALCLQEGLVKKPGEIDMAMLMGTGFPPFRGGPLRLVDQQGIQFIVNQLEYYAETRGERFAPCDLLKEMAEGNQRFYPNI